MGDKSYNSPSKTSIYVFCCDKNTTISGVSYLTVFFDRGK